LELGRGGGQGDRAELPAKKKSGEFACFAKRKAREGPVEREGKT